jgi:hypothetical protein
LQGVQLSVIVFFSVYATLTSICVIGVLFSADFGVSAQITATLAKRKSFIGSPYWYVIIMICLLN